MRQARHEVCEMGEEYYTHAIGENIERKTPPREHKLLWANNIKIDVDRKGRESVQ